MPVAVLKIHGRERRYSKSSKILLEPILRCAAIPGMCREAERPKKVILLALECTDFVEKMFQEGTSCAKTVRAIMEGMDGHTSICPIALPFLQRLYQMSTLSSSSKSAVDHNDTAATREEDYVCQHCKKQDSLEKLMYCGRCQTTNYCSRECQKADWRKHKKTCVPAASI
mmetsp:Transcript_38477/g.93087  ORF Transcript_38477/g.93087 Transcript_38477/m.93087 type:complete len:170 (+) Transcript_38477:813-1322(+)